MKVICSCSPTVLVDDDQLQLNAQTASFAHGTVSGGI